MAMLAHHLAFSSKHKVKQRRARLVLGWVTAWESRVPPAFLIYLTQYWHDLYTVLDWFVLELTIVHTLTAPKSITNYLTAN